MLEDISVIGKACDGEEAVKACRELKRVTMGMKHSEIAKEMNYSEGYIRQLVIKINEKLNLQNSRDLV